MSRHQDYESRTEQLVMPLCEKYNYELVDVEFVKVIDMELKQVMVLFCV